MHDARLTCYAQDDGEVPAAAQPIICNNLERALLMIKIILHLCLWKLPEGNPKINR